MNPRKLKMMKMKMTIKMTLQLVAKEDLEIIIENQNLNRIATMMVTTMEDR
jgi:hypothetical protein